MAKKRAYWRPAKTEAKAVREHHKIDRLVKKLVKQGPNFKKRSSMQAGAKVSRLISRQDENYAKYAPKSKTYYQKTELGVGRSAALKSMKKGKGKGWHGDSAGHARAARSRGKRRKK